MDDPDPDAKVIFVDTESLNRATMQLNFEDLEIGSDLILIDDGDNVVNFFSKMLKNIVTEEIATAVETVDSNNREI